MLLVFFSPFVRESFSLDHEPRWVRCLPALDLLTLALLFHVSSDSYHDHL